MTRSWPFRCAAAALLLGSGGALAAGSPVLPAVPPATAPVTLPEAVQFDMVSQATGRTYRIFVSRPPTPPPPSGWPVIVLTDGNASFPIAAAANRLNAAAGRAALIVAVGYPTDDPREQLRVRSRDLTPITPPEGLPKRPGPPPDPRDFGGAEPFYHFLVDELRSAIAAAYPVDPAAQTLYGHSYGGLFTLGVMFAHPESFARYAISSPSIWWNSRAVLASEPAFDQAVTKGAVAPRISITVGAREAEPATGPLPPGITRADLEKLARDTRMVDNARELAARLSALHGRAPYAVTIHDFAGEDHLSVIPASIARALAFAVAP